MYARYKLTMLYRFNRYARCKLMMKHFINMDYFYDLIG